MKVAWTSLLRSSIATFTNPNLCNRGHAILLQRPRRHMKLAIASLLIKPCVPDHCPSHCHIKVVVLEARDHGPCAAGAKIEVSGFLIRASTPLHATDSVTATRA